MSRPTHILVSNSLFSTPQRHQHQQRKIITWDSSRWTEMNGPLEMSGNMFPGLTHPVGLKMWLWRFMWILMWSIMWNPSLWGSSQPLLARPLREPPQLIWWHSAFPSPYLLDWAVFRFLQAYMPPPPPPPPPHPTPNPTPNPNPNPPPPTRINVPLADAVTQQGLYSLSGKASYHKISQSLEAARFGFLTFPVALKFNWQLGSSAAEIPVKFQSDMVIITSNLATSRLHEIWW